MHDANVPVSLFRSSLLLLAALSPLACFEPNSDDSSADDSMESDDESEAGESLDIRFTLDGQTDPDPIVEAAALELAVEFAPGLEIDRVEFWADGRLLLADSESPYQTWWLASDDSLDGDHEFVARAWSSTGEQGSSTIVAALDMPSAGTPTWQLDGDQLGSVWDMDVIGSEVVTLGDSGLQRLDRTGEPQWQLELPPIVGGALACDPSSGSIHVICVSEGRLVDVRVSPAGELLEWVDLAPAAEHFSVQDAVVRNGELAIAGAWMPADRPLPWIGVFGREGGARWTNDFSDDDLSMTEGTARDLALDDDGNLLVALDAGRGFSPQRTAELHRYDREGELNLFRVLSDSFASHALAVELDSDGMILFAGTILGAAVVARYSNEGSPGDMTTLGESDTLVLGSWRGQAEVSVAVGGKHPMVGRLGAEGMDWTVGLNEVAGQRARALAVDDLGYSFVLYTEVGGGSRLLRLHP